MMNAYYESYTRELGEALRALHKPLYVVGQFVGADYLFAEEEYKSLLELFEKRLKMTPWIESDDAIFEFISGGSSYEEMILELDEIYIEYIQTKDKGERNNRLSHIFEVHDEEGIIVDVLRFDNEEEAAEFEKGLTGNYYVRPHTLPVEDLLELVLDLRMTDLLDEDT